MTKEKDGVSMSKLYKELYEAGLSHDEIEVEIANNLIMQYVDTLSPAEALLMLNLNEGIIRHEDEEEDQLSALMNSITGMSVTAYPVQRATNVRPVQKNPRKEQEVDVRKLRKDVDEIQDQLNDFLIDNHLKNNLNENKEKDEK